MRAAVGNNQRGYQGARQAEPGEDVNHRYRLNSGAWARSIPGLNVLPPRFAMWVIFLEAGLALFLLLIIVWATWPRRRETGEHLPTSDKEREE